MFGRQGLIHSQHGDINDIKMIYQPNIIASTTDKHYEVRLNDWTFLGKGLGHVILQNDQPGCEMYWKVLIICFHEMHTSPRQLEDLYFEVISSLPNIQKHLLIRQTLHFNTEGRQQLREFLKNKLMIEVQLPHDYKVVLADNLNRSKDGWQFSFEFKPKTPLPDKYSSAFMERVAYKHGIKINTLEQMISNRPIQQKTRWFKKNALKTKKANMNPLEIFGICRSELPLIVKKLKKMETFHQNIDLSEQDYKILNRNLYQEISKSSILKTILDLQLLFAAPSDFVCPSLEPLWSQQEEKAKVVEAIRQRVLRDVAQYSKDSISQKVQPLLNSPIVIPNAEHPKEDIAKIQQMFRFLLSWSWRDVSLIIRIKLDPTTLSISAVDFTIIDYEIKESSKLKETIEKDQNFFDNYLAYLKII